MSCSYGGFLERFLIFVVSASFQIWASLPLLRAKPGCRRDESDLRGYTHTYPIRNGAVAKYSESPGVELRNGAATYPCEPRTWKNDSRRSGYRPNNLQYSQLVNLWSAKVTITRTVSWFSSSFSRSCCRRCWASLQHWVVLVDWTKSLSDVVKWTRLYRSRRMVDFTWRIMMNEILTDEIDGGSCWYE